MWQRGPVKNISALLQPVAHAILQAREEVDAVTKHFSDENLWQRPPGVASVGFHLQHLTGVLDRLFTYARAERLDEQQLTRLAEEGKPGNQITVIHLVNTFSKQVDEALQQLSTTEEQTLTDERLVGRAKIPSTVIGLLFHAAEHVMRHVGQLYVTVKVIEDRFKTGL